jgi:uncharacterized protein
MEPRISIITLGVADIKRSLRFYRDGLGWESDAKDDAQCPMFRTSGTRFALFPRDLLAIDAGLGTVEPPGTFSGITLAHNTRTREGVDKVMALAERAGAKIVKPAGKGQYIAYGGYFADPDGYLWEIAWDPCWHFTPTGEMYGGPLGPLPE